MLNKVKKYIHDNKLLVKSGRMLVALSGGADSVCLLLVLRELGYDPVAAHCNFHLRGEESNRDEQFVRQLCEKLGIRLHVTHFNTDTYAKERGLSIEMAAREQRYTYFKQLMAEEHCQAICVAHHWDDNIETMLINLLRGTGIKGLCGIQPKNGSIIRPLLCCCRDDIIRYLNEKGQDYMTDSTNLTTDYLRNKIRLQLIPLMQSITPSAKDTLLTTMDNLNEELKVYEWCMKHMEEEISFVGDDGILYISKDGLLRCPSPLSLLHEVLRDCGFNRSQLRQILSCVDKPGRRFYSSCFKLTVDRDYLVVTGVEDDEERCIELEIAGDEGDVKLPNGWTVSYRIIGKTQLEIQKDRHHAYFDLGKLGRRITIRVVEKGDWFIPFGMSGRKLVSDLLTDMKVPAWEKGRQLVLTSGVRIAWVLGRRSSAEFQVDDETEQIVEMEIKPN